MTAARRVLAVVFGFEAFRPGQEAVIEALLAGRDALAVMPTGSGKSLCFQVPALVMDGLTVVVSPLVALMRDQVAALRLAGVAADGIHSGNDREENLAAWRRASAGRTRLLYMAPERLMTEPMLAALKRLPVTLFAIDEAHCISQWGPAFRPEYADLCRLRALFPGVPLAALTATADEVTRDDIADRLFGGEVEQFVLGFDRPNIRLAVAMKRDWKGQLRDFVARHDGKSGIVYCLSRRKTEEAAALLAAGRGPGAALPRRHGGGRPGGAPEPFHDRARRGHRRHDRLRHGHRQGRRAPCLPCRPAGQRGGLLPGDRPGRARRGAGRGAHALRARRHPDAPAVHRGRGCRSRPQAPGAQALDALLGYCEAPACRRAALLEYFGERIEACGNCDACLDPSERIDGTEDARKILSAVYRSGERFGAAHVIDILRGAQTEKIGRFGHDRLPSFGVGADRGKNEWRSLVRQMVATGYLRLDIAGYGGLGITDRGRARRAAKIGRSSPWSTARRRCWPC